MHNNEDQDDLHIPDIDWVVLLGMGIVCLTVLYLFFQVLRWVV